MPTTSSPPRDSFVNNNLERSLPSTPPTRLSTTSASTTSASSRSPTPPLQTSPRPQATAAISWMETIIAVLSTIQSTIWMYILALETLVRQYMEQYSQTDTEELEKVPVKRDSVSEITGRTRTGTNVRELVIVGGSKRGSLDDSRRCNLQDGGVSEKIRSPPMNSAKGTGFEEPFCRYRNTTLPHPSADLSYNASISAQDIVYAKAHHRVRIPGRRSSNKGVSHGKILPGEEGYSNGGGFGGVAMSESAMGSSLEGLYDNIVYEDGTRELALTKMRTGLSGSTNVGSPVEPIDEHNIPSEKVSQPAKTLAIDSPHPSMKLDWEQETSNALEKIMSPLSRHPILSNHKSTSPKSTYTKRAETPTKSSSTTPRSPTTPSSIPIIKPGGFQRVSSPTSQHGKKDSGIGIVGFEISGKDAAKAKLSGDFVRMDSRNGNHEEEEGEEETTPTKKRERRLLRKIKMQKI